MEQIYMAEQKNPFLRVTAKIGRGIYYLFLKIAFRPKIYYADPSVRKYMKNNPVILISNHTSHNDGQMISMLFSGSMLLMAKDWYEKRFIQWLTYGGNFLSVDRYGVDTAWLRDAVQAIKHNKNVIIFPEGRTSKNGTFHEFKGGFIMLALKTNVPIVPIYSDGEYHPFFGKRARFYVGAPTELSKESKGLNANYLTSESQRFQDLVLQLKKGSMK
jgi:1-acyl-sn-glycerol-3-phosphate acyltransferase